MFSFSVGRSKSFGLSCVMKGLYIRHRLHNLAADWVALVKKSSYTLKRGRQSLYGMYQVAWWKECVCNESEWWGSMKCVGETGRKQGHRTDTATSARAHVRGAHWEGHCPATTRKTTLRPHQWVKSHQSVKRFSSIRIRWLS